MSERIRVMIADDHALVRTGLRLLLQSLGDIDVVAEAQDGREALRLIEQDRPQITLMDIAMPELDGLEATRAATAKFPGSLIIILSMYNSEDYVLRAFQAGASAYILKESAATDLRSAMQAVMRGEIYVCPAIARHISLQQLRKYGGEAGRLRSSG